MPVALRPLTNQRAFLTGRDGGIRSHDLHRSGECWGHEGCGPGSLTRAVWSLPGPQPPAPHIARRLCSRKPDAGGRAHRAVPAWSSPSTAAPGRTINGAFRKRWVSVSTATMKPPRKRVCPKACSASFPADANSALTSSRTRSSPVVHLAHSGRQVRRRDVRASDQQYALTRDTSAGRHGPDSQQLQLSDRRRAQTTPLRRPTFRSAQLSSARSARAPAKQQGSCRTTHPAAKPV